MWNFLHVRLHQPHTYFQNNLQRSIMAENIKKKNHLNYSKQNLTLEATFSLCNTCPANYYLNLSYYICVVGHLDMYASRYHTDAFFIFSTQWALHNSLKKFQNPKRTILWSHILVTNLVTLVIPAIHFAWIPHDHTTVLC